ncbi:hypothetical protein M8J77_007360 [Diaphorina citri]|nr:hypothetical protein M8J77_007360 [Diaphorina citri]
MALSNVLYNLVLPYLLIGSSCANLITDLKEFAYSQGNAEYLTHQGQPNPSARGQVVPLPRESYGWPNVPIPFLGQISGVSINLHGHPVLFHRGKRVWDETSFNASFIFQHTHEGPISVDTVLTLDKSTGLLIDAWGKNKFYMPHGCTVDNKGFIWLTDVALHQVFKFTPHGKTPQLTLGSPLEPGSDTRHLCMPTAVAVASDGQFFVSDGYCNARVLKYNQQGYVVRVFPQQQEYLSLNIPHSITLLEPHDLLCIADRENRRVVCVGAELRSPSQYSTTLSVQPPGLGRVFAITSIGDLVFAVNGPTSPQIAVQGFTISPFGESVLDTWAPTSVRFHNPHDIAISKNGTELYVVETSPNRIWKFDTSQWVDMNQFAYMPLEK